MDASFLPEALSTAWRAIQLGEGPGAQEGGAAAPVEEMSIAGWVGQNPAPHQAGDRQEEHRKNRL